MLQISNLSFSYQNQPILENLNLSLTSPDIVGIIGDNGTGKTTLFRLITRELHPDEGYIKTSGKIGFLKQIQGNLPGKSGGERTQIRLAELFRQNPDILLLDEPTNNLDHESRAWLLRNLHNYRGLTLIVSHDRDFLNTIAQKILYLHHGKCEIFSGNYTDFHNQQVQKQNEQARLYEQSQREKKKLDQQLKILHSRINKSNHQSYNKINDESKLRYNGQKMNFQNSTGKTLRAVQKHIAQISPIEKPFECKTYIAKVSANSLHRKKLLEVINLAKSYGKKNLYTNLNFEIHTGERIRICGRNGSGKSTLFQIILGEITPDTGEVRISPNIEIGYISQDTPGFISEKSFLAQNYHLNQTEIFRAATTMDFTPQDITRPTSELSRGQLTKLAILRLILHPLDLIIIDEITNHIDIRARENVAFALKKYPGAILAATHDEAFARELNFNQELFI